MFFVYFYDVDIWDTYGRLWTYIYMTVLFDEPPI